MYQLIRQALPEIFLQKDICPEELEEIRLRCGQYTMLCGRWGEQRVGYIPAKEDIRRILMTLAEHSIHAYGEQIRHGFLTLRGGIRIGIGGRAIEEAGVIRRIEDFTSLNIRFPRELHGLADRLIPYLLQQGRPVNTLLLSPPQAGKTTLLRDLVRCISAGEGCIACKCAVIDSREELWSENFDLGPRTDILRCDKAAGMQMALRTLSPQVMATDELGDPREWDALLEMMAAGVALLATAHGNSLEEWSCRPLFEKIWKYRLIKRYVILSDSLGKGTVEQVLDEYGQPMLLRPMLLGSEEPVYVV